VFLVRQNWMFTSQKTAFYTVTAVKTSNYTELQYCLLRHYLASGQLHAPGLSTARSDVAAAYIAYSAG
jgi:hypothetical protein